MWTLQEATDILAAFKTYYATAELAEATDPNLILELKAKLDAQNHYDDFEIDRVVKVLMDPNSKQSQLQGARANRSALDGHSKMHAQVQNSR